MARYLRIVALGTDHPAFPPEPRELVRAGAVEMTGWQAALADVLEPLEELVASAEGCPATRPWPAAR